MPLKVDALIRDIKVAYKRLNSSEQASVSSKKPNPSKSATKANELREVGNRYFQKKKFEDALSSYTRSIAYALDGSEELSKAYGNRSAVLFELEKYASCLLDINRVLKDHCPDFRRQKLLDRKERCLTRMKSSAGGCGDADDEIDEDALNPPTDQEPTWRADLLSKFGNPLLSNASPKIKLKYDRKWGRHFVATANIEPGEPLLSENFFVTVLFADDSRFTYCDLCNTSCDALIPCLSCARTMYCSEECRVRAYDSYHRMECKLYSFLVPYSSVNEAVAIRMFLIGAEQGSALENLMNTLSIADIFAENFDFSNKPTGSDYLTALRLTLGTFDQTRVRLHIKDAVEVINILRRFEFFESVPVDRLRDAEVFATALLLNGFSSDRYINRFLPTNESPANIGTASRLIHGLVLLQYLFNHSCFPNVNGAYRRKREDILIALRPIKKDEQLFVRYYDDFIDTPKAERIRHLDFTCRCEACSNNWPTYVESGIPSMTSKLNILARMIKDCKPSNDIRERGHVLSDEIMNVAAPLLDNTMLISLRVDEILQIVAKMMSLLHNVMVPMSLPLVELRHYLFFFAELYYDERERDPIQNRNLKFPVSTNEAWATSQRLVTLNEKILNMQAVTTIYDVICKLKWYSLKCHFIKKKMIG